VYNKNTKTLALLKHRNIKTHLKKEGKMFAIIKALICGLIVGLFFYFLFEGRMLDIMVCSLGVFVIAWMDFDQK